MDDSLIDIPFWRLLPTLARFRLRAVKAILIHGHMRCGSTLLVHLLCQHPSIAGVGETHAGYRSGRDIARLFYRIESVSGQRLPRSTRWIVDKLLHDLPFAIERLSSAHRHLFIAREPRAAIASMMRPDFSPITSMAQADAYYCRRMRTLLDLHRQTKDRGLRSRAFTYETLADDSERLLSEISAWLCLDPPLAATYDLLPTAGRPGFGDRSATLRAGRIVSRDARAEAPELASCSHEATRLFELFSSNTDP